MELDLDLQVVQNLVQRYPDMESLFTRMPEDIKLHGIRVAEYTQAMYNAGVEVEINPFDEKSAKERSSLYSRYMFMAGKYHDIGVMCMPEDSPYRRPDVQAPELSNDVEHVLFGNVLSDYYAQASHYQPQMLWVMMGETLRSHHEKYDGSGFPDKLMTDQMPLSAWIVSVAVMLDVETAYPFSENPFKERFQRMLDFVMENKLNELELVLRVAESKLERVFQKHISESNMITYKPMLIKHTAKRSMYLKYRRVNYLMDNELVAFQALPIFQLKSRKENMYFDEIADKLKEAKITASVWNYFLYEASDMRVRMEAYGLSDIIIQVPILPGILSQNKVDNFFDPWIKETKTDISRYCFMIEPDMLAKPSKTLITNLNRITEYGAKLMMIDFTGEQAYNYEDIGITINFIQLSSILLDRMNESIKESVAAVEAAGIIVQADGIDSDDYNELLESMHVRQMCGDYPGEYKNDTEILIECCALKNNFD